MPADSSYSALAATGRRRVLGILRAAAGNGLSVSELASATGLHANTVRFHLGVLSEAGYAEERTERRGGRGRPRTLYTASLPDTGEEGYRLLAEMLTGHLDGTEEGAATAEQAGRTWARRSLPSRPVDEARATATDPVTRRVVALFTEMGFEPEAAPDGPDGRVLLRACPFQQLARERPGVVCAVHLGLLREVVEQATGGALDAGLRPFAEPGLCVAEVGPGAFPAEAEAEAVKDTGGPQGPGKGRV